MRLLTCKNRHCIRGAFPRHRVGEVHRDVCRRYICATRLVWVEHSRFPSGTAPESARSAPWSLRISFCRWTFGEVSDSWGSSPDDIPQSCRLVQWESPGQSDWSESPMPRIGWTQSLDIDHIQSLILYCEWWCRKLRWEKNYKIRLDSILVFRSGAKFFCEVLATARPKCDGKCRMSSPFLQSGHWFFCRLHLQRHSKQNICKQFSGKHFCPSFTDE